MSVECLHPINISGKLRPCGHCEVCRHKTIKDWITRVSLDIKALKKKKRQSGVKGVNSSNGDRKCTDSIFFDLTYNNQFLPVDQSLNIGDYQKFLKRFRRRYERKYRYTGIRFIASGEYGDSEDGTHRPHYHFVMWNLPNLSIEEHRENVKEAWKSNGFVFEDNECKIPVIDKKTGKWKRGRVSMGFSKVDIPRGQTGAAFYVAESVGYVTKNGLSKYCRHGNESLEDFRARTGKCAFPFIRASLGLGYDYVDDCADQIIRQGYIQDGEYKVRIPPIYQSRLKRFVRKTFFLNKLIRMSEFYSDVPFEFNRYEVDQLADILSAQDLFFERLRNFQNRFFGELSDMVSTRFEISFDFIRKKRRQYSCISCCDIEVFRHKLERILDYCIDRACGCELFPYFDRLYFYCEDYLDSCFLYEKLIYKYSEYDRDLGSYQLSRRDNCVQAGVNFLAKMRIQSAFREKKAVRRVARCLGGCL